MNSPVIVKFQLPKPFRRSRPRRLSTVPTGPIPLGATHAACESGAPPAPVPESPGADGAGYGPRLSRVARMLALSYRVQRMIDDGEVKDYAAAAKTIGVTRARITQISNLTLLSPSIQARLLTGELRLAERQLRKVVSHAAWDQQLAVIDAMAITHRSATNTAAAPGNR